MRSAFDSCSIERSPAIKVYWARPALDALNGMKDLSCLSSIGNENMCRSHGQSQRDKTGAFAILHLMLKFWLVIRVSLLILRGRTVPNSCDYLKAIGI